MKKVGLFFGSFNPVHIGHLIIANHMVEYTHMDEVWFVVSPQNPEKEKASMLADHHRLALVRIAVEDNPKLRVSNVEFDLPKPSYTIRTLVALEEKHPDKEFSLIMGEDNLRGLHRWKSHAEIVEKHPIYVYPRLVEKEVTDANQYVNHPMVHRLNAPVMKVSASFIRSAIKEGRSVQYLLSEPVRKYLEEMHFYE
ncbi:MAG: nicotinate (nicotinamide) nucleotide adenylyltransferase [Salibacteraceae bacterium]